MAAIRAKQRPLIANIVLRLPLWLLGGAATGLAISALFGGMVWLALSITVPGDAEGRAKCDQAVAALLESRDPVELQRADILIRHLNCGVKKRLPRLESRG